MLIGVDIGGTKIAAGVVDADGRVLERIQASTPVTRGAEAIVTTAAELVQGLLRSHGPVSAVGVGSAGQVDHESGIVVDANENLPGFRGLPLRERLEELLQLPVAVENDVKAAALAEAQLGAGRGVRQMLLVMVGTGIGGALVLDGKVYRGASGVAGELGHLLFRPEQGRLCPCGRRGCIEGYASGRAIMEIYAEESGRSIDVATIAKRARDGETLAREVLTQAGRALGLTLGGLINTLSPEAIVLGGGVLQVEELYLPVLEYGLQMQALPVMRRSCTVRRMELVHDAVLIGASLLAKERTEDGRRGQAAD